MTRYLVMLPVNMVYWGVGETTIVSNKIPSKLSHTPPHFGPRAPRVSQTRKRARPAGLNLMKEPNE